MKVLITGGLGYIGSNVTLTLIKHGFDVIILDNLSNSNKDKLEIMKLVSSKNINFYTGDIRDHKLLDNIFKTENIESVIHLAGLKSINESNLNPVNYYSNNFNGTLILIEAMKRANIFSLIFSSSATVYGNPNYLPIDEKHSLSPLNPYGKSKYFIEMMLEDLHRSDPTWKILSLRYFNPIGAHESGLIGEDPNGIPNNLSPILFRVAGGEEPFLRIFGNDYPTIDGTGIRDYIDINDLANAHLSAVKYLNSTSTSTYEAINIGTGRGYSVLEIVKTLNTLLNSNIPIKFVSRRPGDVASCYASVKKAELLLGWRATREISDMCKSGWLYYKNKNIINLRLK